jgi:hypothetical protein
MISDIGQIETHTAEPLVPEPSPYEAETAIAKLKKYKSPGSEQILAEFIQAKGETLCSEIHKLTNSTWSKEDLPDQWKESIIVQIYREGDETGYSNCCRMSCPGLLCHCGDSSSVPCGHVP